LGYNYKDTIELDYRRVVRIYIRLKELRTEPLVSLVNGFGINSIEADQIKFQKLMTALLIWLKNSGIHKARNFMSISTQKEIAACLIGCGLL
jgi:hypothetical protein